MPFIYFPTIFFCNSSSLLFIAPINIALLSRLYFQRLPIIDRVFTWFTVLSQFTAMLVSLCPTAYYSKVIHHSQKYIPALQTMLPQNKLVYKWKCLSLYERLTSGAQYAFTIGPHSALTNKVLLEVIT